MKRLRPLLEDPLTPICLPALHLRVYVGANGELPRYRSPVSLEALEEQLDNLTERVGMAESECAAEEARASGDMPQDAKYILIGRDLPLIFLVLCRNCASRSRGASDARTRFIIAAARELGQGELTSGGIEKHRERYSADRKRADRLARMLAPRHRVAEYLAGWAGIGGDPDAGR